MTISNQRLSGLACSIIIVYLIAYEGVFASDWKLWYEHPARVWEEALPVGNGRLGGMVFGGIDRARISLNEESIWSGAPAPVLANNTYQLLLKRQQELLFAGKHSEAKNLKISDIDLPEDFQVREERIPGTSIARHIYKPLADLYLHFDIPRDVPSDYYRELDLDRAVATVSYKLGQVTYTREVFCSHPDQVLVVRITADKPAAVSFSSSMTRRVDVKADMYRYDAELGAKVESITRPPEPKIETIAPGRMTFSGRADPNGVSFVADFRVVSEGGEVTRIPDGFRVQDADSAVIYMTAATDFDNEQPKQIARQHMDLVSEIGFEELMDRHITDHQSLFRRVDIDLGTSRNARLPTDKRVLAMRLGVRDPRVPKDRDRDPNLYALYFQYGRYLMIASSRPGTMPPALQGIWNDSLLPPWFGGHYSDINVEMNYWPVEVCNLSECHLALLDFVEGFSDTARASAEIAYGARGMVINGMTAYGPKKARSGWQDFGGWLAQHFWEHYAFTGDIEYLADHAYPFMRDNTLFYLDFLVEDPDTGWLVTGPTYSPENHFLYPGGTRGHEDMGVTISLAIVRDLFNNTITASRILRVDEDLRNEIAEALKHLAPYQIGKHGQIQEWLDDYEESIIGHRHMSHLFGLSPGRSITPRKTPELAEAARVSLLRRLEHGGGWTGWSRAWALNLAVRLKDGEFAYEQLKLQLERTTYDNLFDSHPRRGGNTMCFQIEGNFGATAGIAEMLLQSHEEEIEILPALPEVWPEGSVTGLRARGGFEIDIVWNRGSLKEVCIKPTSGKECIVRYGEKAVVLKTQIGREYRFNSKLEPI